MAFDYSKLRGRIVERFGTQQAFAEAMKWSERTLSLKLSGKRHWKQDDICKALDLLHIEESEIPIYFFTTKVQDNEL